MIDYQNIIDKHYPAATPLRDIYMRHCQSVAQEALAISHNLNLPLDDNHVLAAAMLHDIGIFLTDAPSIECRGPLPYLQHGVVGELLLIAEGVPSDIAAVAALHTGSGLTASEIEEQNLPLPHIDLLPKTLLQRLICYADKFYSKSGSMQRKNIEAVRRSMSRHDSKALERFDRLTAEFSHQNKGML